MPPTIPIYTPETKKPKIILISISVIIVIVIAIAVAFTFFMIQKNNTANLLKDELSKVAVLMDKKQSELGAYPTDLSSVLGAISEKVDITGETSFDGTSYCIAAKSKSDNNVSYYINSSKEPVVGTCDTESEILLPPLAPGGLAVAVANSESIKVTWNSSLYATSYVLQCSDDDKFTDAKSYTTDETAATCDGLNSKKMYYYRARAVNNSGDSAWSVVQKMSTL